MSRFPRAASLALCLIGASACSSLQDEVDALTKSPTAVARATRLRDALADNDSSGDPDAPLAYWVMPPALQEISGLALTDDGRLLVHNDEMGQVWEVDYRRGIVLKRFTLGADAIKADFEGMAIANGVVFMLTSHGKLYEFREGESESHVEYRVHDTGLRKTCEFEGVAFDSTINTLLLACKNVLDKRFKDALVIYRWSLAGDAASRLSQLTVPLASIIGTNEWKTLRPSDITVDPQTGNYVLVASQENALIVITPAGTVVLARALPEIHQMAEGVAITRDSILIVSDETGKRPASITLYRWPGAYRVPDSAATPHR